MGSQLIQDVRSGVWIDWEMILGFPPSPPPPTLPPPPDDRPFLVLGGAYELCAVGFVLWCLSER